MTAEKIWTLFCATGAPQFYLLYKDLTGAEEAPKSA
jgi:hypothetical protein